MKRRDFVKHFTTAGASLGLAPSLTAQRSQRQLSPNDRIQVGLIGTRNQGVGTLLKTLVGDLNCQVVALCDVDASVLQDGIDTTQELYSEYHNISVQGSVHGYRDFRQLLQDESIDAVVIATPDHWHVPIAKAAILAGKDVYVEKPLSFYVTEGRELADLVRLSDRIVQVGSQQRSEERFLMAQDAVQSGYLGDIRHLEVLISTRSGKNQPWEPQPVPPELDYDMYVGPAPWTDYHPDRVHYNFRFVPDFSGGEIANWGAHFLDTAQHCLGADHTGPISVVGAGRRHPAGSLHYSFFAIDLDFEYANGITMKFRSDDDRGVWFHGSEGRLFVSRGEISTEPKDLIRSFPRDLGDRIRKTKGSHISNWFDCIRSRRAEDLHAPVEAGHRSATLCHLSNIALELERPLFWNPDEEVFRNDAHANALLNRPVREKWRI